MQLVKETDLMKPPILILLFTIFFIHANGRSQKDSIAYVSDHLKIISLSAQSYVHISYLQTDDYGKVPCNGLVYLHNGEAVVIDTPADETGSLELIDWITKKKAHRLKAVVANHFHYDCVGGLEIFHQYGVASYANEETLSLAEKRGNTIPLNGFDTELDLNIGDTTVTNRFMGAAHTRDNIISYIPTEKLLFGGCMVKSIGAGKGNLADAEIAEWSNTMKKIKDAYPDIEIVVPGHGNSGGTELLDYTEELFKSE